MAEVKMDAHSVPFKPVVKVSIVLFASKIVPFRSKPVSLNIQLTRH